MKNKTSHKDHLNLLSSAIKVKLQRNRALVRSGHSKAVKSLKLTSGVQVEFPLSCTKIQAKTHKCKSRIDRLLN